MEKFRTDPRVCGRSLVYGFSSRNKIRKAWTARAHLDAPHSSARSHHSRINSTVHATVPLTVWTVNLPPPGPYANGACPSPCPPATGHGRKRSNKAKYKAQSNIGRKQPKAKATQGNTRQHKAAQDSTDKATRDKTRQDKTRQHNAR